MPPPKLPMVTVAPVRFAVPPTKIPWPAAGFVPEPPLLMPPAKVEIVTDAVLPEKSEEAAPPTKMPRPAAEIVPPLLIPPAKVEIVTDAALAQKDAEAV